MTLLKPILKLLVLDSKRAYLIFWSILLFVTATAILLSNSYSGVSISFGSNFAVYIFLMIFAMHTVKETFSFSLGMGSTRSAYYLGSIFFLILVALLTALLQNLYIGAVDIVLALLGIEQITFLNLGFLESFQDQYFLILLFDFIIALFIITLFYLIATIQYRFGLLPVLAIAVIALFGIMTPGVQNIFLKLVNVYHLSNGLTIIAMIMLLSITLFFLFGWLVMRSASIRSA